ncbi:protein VACUOLELESS GAMETOPHYTES-like [Solanum dulcamara]|uniref:protein VACUOLELESS GAMETOPHYTES-like n=1 Tax=Solanum dulcamara TaxID=45834 RepID=UPI00248506BB|nr:protein VACUOLELESS GAMETOPHYTES-like [Solanum dulcamara]
MGRQNRSTNAAPQGKEHFSHSHILKLIVNDPTETETLLTCNACEQPNNSNKPFYGCNTCQYFLHENCFNAPRFLNHPSHPSHPLTLLPIATYSSRSYTCKACDSAGNGFCFSCACCEFDIHLQCASCPSSILVDKHAHQLELHFGSPYEDKDIDYVCDICTEIMNKDDWLYYCAACDFASHLQCAIISPEVSVFPKQQRPIPNSNTNPNPNPNPTPNRNPNATLEMINSANEAHEQIMAAQISAQIAARGREACLDLIAPRRRYSYY